MTHFFPLSRHLKEKFSEKVDELTHAFPTTRKIKYLCFFLRDGSLPCASVQPSIQHPRAHGAVNRGEFAAQFRRLGLVGADVGDDVTELGVGAQELAVDVEPVA